MNMSTLPGFPPARLEADALMTFEKQPRTVQRMHPTPVWRETRQVFGDLSGLVPLRISISTLPGFPPARLEANALITFEEQEHGALNAPYTGL
jgi:hypothetical protein